MSLPVLRAKESKGYTYSHFMKSGKVANRISWMTANLDNDTIVMGVKLSVEFGYLFEGDAVTMIKTIPGIVESKFYGELVFDGVQWVIDNGSYVTPVTAFDEVISVETADEKHPRGYYIETN